MTGGAGGGDRGTGTEGADIGHRLGQGTEGGVVVVVPGDLCVDVPIGHPAVHRRGRLAALVAGLIGRPSAGSQASHPSTGQLVERTLRGGIVPICAFFIITHRCGVVRGSRSSKLNPETLIETTP